MLRRPFAPFCAASLAVLLALWGGGALPTAAAAPPPALSALPPEPAPPATPPAVPTIAPSAATPSPPASSALPPAPPPTSWSPFRPPNQPAPPSPPPPPGPGRPPVKLSIPEVPDGPSQLSAPDLRYDLRIDVPITVAGYVAWGTLQALNEELARRRCRWCDDDLNWLDRTARDRLRWAQKDRRLAETLSDIGANALAPALTVGLSAVLAAYDRRFYEVPIDFVLVAEATTAAGVLTQIVKYSVGRMRPDARALPPSERPRSGHGEDAYVSFFSGHTSYVFVLASSAATIAWMRRYPGYGWVAVVGLSVASATAYLRIAADKHYLTDVLAAAGTSSLVGFSIPYFFHRPVRYLVPLTPTATPTKGGAMLGLSGVFLAG